MNTSQSPVAMPASLMTFNRTRTEGELPHVLEVDPVMGLLSRARFDFDQAATDFEIATEAAPASAARFNGAAKRCRELLAEARKLPKSPRAASCQVLLQRHADQETAAITAWNAYSEKLAAAQEALIAAAREYEQAKAAAELGSLDAAEADRLNARVVTATAALKRRRVEAAHASEVPPKPTPSLPAEVVDTAAANTEDLERFYMDHGVQLDDDAEERPPIDVIAIAKRQALDATEDEAALWPLFEARALGLRLMRAVTPGRSKDELTKVFERRARYYRERVRYGEFAR